jgi:putative ABC transport system permease protein
MSRMMFYLQYAARNLWRNRRWSTFAVFSVAAGVATVVALRSLGLAIGDSLTANVRASNHGDVTFTTGNSGFLSFGNPDEESVFDTAQVQRVHEWVSERGGRMTAYTSSGNIQITALEFETAGRPQFINTFFIDPATYPPTDDILAIDPAGVQVGDLFQGGNEVVVSENLASTQGIEVGDHVRASGTTEEFIVRGIVPTQSEAGLRNIAAAFFGFAYFPNNLAVDLPTADQPNRVSITLPDGATANEIAVWADQLGSILRGDRRMRTYTVPELIQQNQSIADVVSSFIVVLGLGALLIGGVGIINTMLVMVGRRTDEIAALKTFGLKGRQVAAMFMAEAFLLGLAGSLVGGVFGVILSGAANAYGATLIQQPLTWRIHPDAVLFGLTLGMVVTIVFGVVPVLTAVKVRPAIILRPNETSVPRMGLLQSLGVILIVVVVIGIIAGQILQPAFQAVPDRVSSRVDFFQNPTLIGIISVAGTLLVLGMLVGLLWLLVWFVGKLPSFGLVDLRLALRNLTTRRTRTATTLLALSAGMFALSSIAFFGAGAREIVQFTLSEAFGGNVIIFPILPPQIAQPLINVKLNTLEGIDYRTRLANFSGEIVAVDGTRVEAGETSPRELAREMARAASDGDFDRVNELSQRLQNVFVNMAMRDTDNPAMTSGELLTGRDLTLDDKGRQVAVIRTNPMLESMGAGIGSVITINVNGREFGFEIIGFLPTEDFQNLQSSVAFGDVLIPSDSLPGVSPDFQFNVIQVAPEQLNNVLLELSSLPLVFSMDITFIDGLLSRFIDQMSAIPILVGLLSLLAAAVIMANTVALSTLERRRQIGILKAIGLKGRRILRIMLLENTLVSLLGGALGLGLSALGVYLMTKFGLDVAKLVPNEALPVAIALVAASVLIGWVATFLSANVAIRERVLNVLRYE